MGAIIFVYHSRSTFSLRWCTLFKEFPFLEAIVESFFWNCSQRRLRICFYFRNCRSNLCPFNMDLSLGNKKKACREQIGRVERRREQSSHLWCKTHGLTTLNSRTRYRDGATKRCRAKVPAFFMCFDKSFTQNFTLIRCSCKSRIAEIDNTFTQTITVLTKQRINNLKIGSC